VTRIALIDHGAGNLVSMERALRRTGALVSIVEGAFDTAAFDGLVLPGVGATGPAMRTLRRTGLVDSIRGFEGPLLGVCVGMQLLFDRSREDATTCLGLIDGVVRPIDASPLPHMGWNDVHHDGAEPFGAVPAGALAYFVHSFAAHPSDPDVVAATTTYGTDTFASAVRLGNVLGVQFHPERSGATGLSVLEGFVSMCRMQARAA
jgi:imidazole glycerol-phosphate synthase subunit HisH